MAESDSESERIARIAKIDAITASPEKRALRVYECIKRDSDANEQRLTNWDMICFCTEYLAQQAAAFGWLTPLMKQLVGLIYYAHYYEGEEMQLYSIPVATGAEAPKESVQ